MSTVESILKALEGIPAWKRVVDAVGKIAKLEQKVEALEKRLERLPSACPGCGGLEFRATGTKPHPTMGRLGAFYRLMKCKDCGHDEEHLITPGGA